jgi:hypothetical protein
MILDAYNTFSDDQAITASAASTNVINLGPLAAGNGTHDIGSGEELHLAIVVGTAFAGATSLQVALETDSDEGFGAPTVVTQTAAIVTADLTKGAIFELILPKADYKQYVRTNYTVVGGPFTAGTVTTSIAETVDTQRQYANNNDINL